MAYRLLDPRRLHEFQLYLLVTLLLHSIFKKHNILFHTEVYVRRSVPANVLKMMKKMSKEH